MLKLVPLPEFDPVLIGYYLNWFNDPEISYQIAPGGGLPKTAASVLGWMRSSNANPTEQRFTMVLDEDDQEKPIGGCALVSINRDLGSAGIIIFIGPEHLRGNGLGKAALRLLINHAFTELALKRLFLGVDVANFRAFNAYIKCGFVEVARHSLPVPGATPRWECLMELENSRFKVQSSGLDNSSFDFQG